MASTSSMAAMLVRTAFLVCPAMSVLAPRVGATDFLLTIGGGYSREQNQASLERNVQFFERLLREQQQDALRHDIYFADGSAEGEDLQVIDPTRVPKVNRLMAEFFGSDEDLGLRYRNHQIQGVRAAATPQEIRRWFKTTGSTMQAGDRLILYVTSHGEEGDDENPHDTTISLWGEQSMTVREVNRLLDELSEGVSVVAVMVQCHAGGFARFIYEDADPDKGLSRQSRCGFFATTYDRIAAGCTADIDESTYVEYSTYFWEALGGMTRLGEPVPIPDYNGDGAVSFDEAHAYTILKSDTIDMPIKTSGEYLGVESRFQSGRHANLLPKNPDFSSVMAIATPLQRIVLEGLSEQLELGGEDRIEEARRRAQPPRRGRRRRFGRSSRPEDRLRREIARDLEQRWPALANLLNPEVVDLLTTGSDEFVNAVEKHPRYGEYRRELREASGRLDQQEVRAKYQRFVNAAENSILLENLRRLNDAKRLASYDAIVEAERGLLFFAAEP